MGALRATSEVYDLRVTRAGGGPNAVSTPLLLRDAGARRGVGSRASDWRSVGFTGSDGVCDCDSGDW